MGYDIILKRLAIVLGLSYSTDRGIGRLDKPVYLPILSINLYFFQ